MIVVGQLAPHITTEVDCESLFSQAGHLSDPTCASTKTRTFERLVIAKHRMQRIHCCPQKVKALYLKRKRANDWDEKTERDDNSFLEAEKEIYLTKFPENVGMFNADE